MNENPIKDRIQVAVSSWFGAKTFTNVVGKLWGGKHIGRTKDGITMLLGARPIDVGLKKKSADLIGYVPYIIQPKDVGRKIGIFVSGEIKRPGEFPDPGQMQWMQDCRNDGCLAFWANSVDMAVKAFYDYFGEELCESENLQLEQNPPITGVLRPQRRQKESRSTRT